MLRRNVGLAVAAGAVALAAIGTAVAAIPGGDGVVQACVAEEERDSRTGLLGPRVTLDREGTLRAVDAEAGEVCADDEQPLSFNVKGEQGEPGEPGPPGEPGAPGEPGVGLADAEWRHEQFDVPPGPQVEPLVVACPGDPGQLGEDAAVSGGYLDVDGKVLSSGPRDGGPTNGGWRVDVINNTGSVDEVHVSVLCAPLE